MKQSRFVLNYNTFIVWDASFSLDNKVHVSHMWPVMWFLQIPMVQHISVKGSNSEQVRNVILIRLEVMLIYHEIGLVWFMVFKTTYNNISVWWSVLLVEETGVPGQNHRHVVSQWQTLSPSDFWLMTIHYLGL